ncbi:hypothetical protein ACH4MM_15860 [Streptomyces pratensis]|uniref:hypothetical protein n=1 Tax=Streptomyces pratensis TaxID=1169025 RepID=UPI0037B1F23D
MSAGQAAQGLAAVHAGAVHHEPGTGAYVRPEAVEQPGQLRPERRVQRFSGPAQFDHRAVRRHRAAGDGHRVPRLADPQTRPRHADLQAVGERQHSLLPAAEARHRRTPAQQPGIRVRGAHDRVHIRVPARGPVGIADRGPYGVPVRQTACGQQRKPCVDDDFVPEGARQRTARFQYVVLPAGGDPDPGARR